MVWEYLIGSFDFAIIETLFDLLFVGAQTKTEELIGEGIEVIVSRCGQCFDLLSFFSSYSLDLLICILVHVIDNQIFFMLSDQIRCDDDHVVDVIAIQVYGWFTDDFSTFVEEKSVIIKCHQNFIWVHDIKIRIVFAGDIEVFVFCPDVGVLVWNELLIIDILFFVFVTYPNWLIRHCCHKGSLW